MAKSCALTVYSFQHVAVVINGRDVVGLWEGDNAVEVQPHAPIGTPMVGVDGSAIMSVTADLAATITLRLQGTSPTHQWLQDRYRLMRTGVPRQFPLSIRDTANGEGGNSSQVLIMNSPGRPWGANAASRDWVLFAQCWETNPVRYTFDLT